ncbi:hypothetical protein G6F24_016022 [Rhizopus arrhizus]|nr:hypothetical protein G6F24_016022 [Rhizopus arrhizus]
MNKRRRVALAVLAGLMTSLALPQMSRAAEGYPNRPLRLIAPSSPGGILDITSRIVGKKLSERLGQPVVVENVPGAAGILGMQSLLRAEPDGYTMQAAVCDVRLRAGGAHHHHAECAGRQRQRARPDAGGVP